MVSDALVVLLELRGSVYINICLPKTELDSPEKLVGCLYPSLRIFYRIAYPSSHPPPQELMPLGLDVLVNIGV